jgi:hypothetical protein
MSSCTREPDTASRGVSRVCVSRFYHCSPRWPYFRKMTALRFFNALGLYWRACHFSMRSSTWSSGRLSSQSHYPQRGNRTAAPRRRWGTAVTIIVTVAVATDVRRLGTTYITSNVDEVMHPCKVWSGCLRKRHKSCILPALEKRYLKGTRIGRHGYYTNWKLVNNLGVWRAHQTSLLDADTVLSIATDVW